jgi:hypothetical protein
MNYLPPNHSRLKCRRNEQRLEQVIRFVEDLDVGGLRDLRDLMRDLVTELFRTVKSPRRDDERSNDACSAPHPLPRRRANPLGPRTRRVP